MAAQQLTDKFYSLSGNTVAEKLKCLNQFISDMKSGYKQDEIDQFIADIKPKNDFEKLLKGRLIDSFRKSHELVEALKCDDKLFIKQVIGCNWFFDGSSIDFPSCEFFMTDVFPNTSFSTRNDIIHMLSFHLKNNHVAEQFFEAVNRQYGIEQGRPLLCNCSAHFIQSILDSDNGEVQFTQKEVSMLCKIHPQIVKCNIKKKCFARHVSKILEVMLEVDINIFHELFESKDCDVNCVWVYLKIGRRLAKKIIHTNSGAIIKSAAKYVKILKPKYLYEFLTAEEFTKFYISLFPESCNDPSFFNYHDELYTVIDVVPPTKRWEILLSSFEKVYGKSLLEQTVLVGEKLLAWLPPDKREKCVQLKIDKCLTEDIDETLWVCYLPSEKSIPVLKKYLIEASDLSERSRFISHLILTCKINEDLEGLECLCKEVASRYRNDHFSLLFNFLKDLHKKFDLVNLGDRHWSSVLEVVNIVFLNEDYHKKPDLLSDILTKSVHYKLNRNNDISKQIDQLIIVKSLMCSSVNNWIVLEKEPKYQVVIFKAFSERIPQIEKVKVALSEIALSFLESVAMWNKKNKLFPFTLSKFQWAVENLRKNVEADMDKKKKISMLDLLTYDLETKQLLFPDYICGNRNEKNGTHFMKMSSEDFMKTAEKEVLFLLDNWPVKNKQLFRTWNLLSFTKVKETVVQICTRVVESDTDTHRREKAIIVLSFLLDAESFSNLIAPFSPISDKITVGNKMEEVLPLVKTSAKCLHYINPWHDFSTITQFCKGDYLKYVIGSLTSVCYNTSENRVVPFLERLTDSPVSVKKHAMRLSFYIVSKAQVFSVIDKLWSLDKNPAIREILFKLVFQAFLNECTSDMFKLLKFCINGLRVDDKNTFCKLALCSQIPDNFQAEYMELCWYKLHDLLEQGAKTKEIISYLAPDLPRIVAYLPSSFCDYVLKQYMVKDSYIWDEISNFAVVYLLYSKTQEILSTRFDIILNLLKELLLAGSSVWKDVTEFFKKLCMEAVGRDHKCINLEIVYQLLQKCVVVWPSLLSTIYSFETFIFLQFSTIYYSCAPQFDLQVFGKLSSEYGASVIEEFGLEIITLVGKTFEHFTKSIRCRDEDSDWEERPLKVIRGVLTEPTTKYAYIMAAYLIPDYFECHEKQRDRYSDLVASLFRIKDRTVVLVISSLPAFNNNFELLDHEVQGDKNTVTTVLTSKTGCTLV